MTRLSPSAKSALESLHEKHLAYTIAKTTIEQELKTELQRRLSIIRHERDLAIRLAADSGVPKTQLGKAIGTSNYKTIQDILAQTEGYEPSGHVASATSKVIVTAGENLGEYAVFVNNLGEQSVTGSAIVELIDGEPQLVDGDAFVLPQIYRNNLGSELTRQIQALG